MSIIQHSCFFACSFGAVFSVVFVFSVSSLSSLSWLSFFLSSSSSSSSSFLLPLFCSIWVSVAWEACSVTRFHVSESMGINDMVKQGRRTKIGQGEKNYFGLRARGARENFPPPWPIVFGTCSNKGRSAYCQHYNKIYLPIVFWDMF